jgi:hypothetical protein
MDDSRFDEWARRLSTSGSRRQGLRLLGVSIASALVATVQPAAAAQRSKKCGKRTCAGDEQCVKSPGGPTCCPAERVCGKTCLASPCANGSICGRGACVCDPATTCTSPQVLNPSTCACECSATTCSAPKTHVNATTCDCECPSTCAYTATDPEGNEACVPDFTQYCGYPCAHDVDCTTTIVWKPGMVCRQVEGPSVSCGEGYYCTELTTCTAS